MWSHSSVYKAMHIEKEQLATTPERYQISLCLPWDIESPTQEIQVHLRYACRVHNLVSLLSLPIMQCRASVHVHTDVTSQSIHIESNLVWRFIISYSSPNSIVFILQIPFHFRQVFYNNIMFKFFEVNLHKLKWASQACYETMLSKSDNMEICCTSWQAQLTKWNYNYNCVILWA